MLMEHVRKSGKLDITSFRHEYESVSMWINFLNTESLQVCSIYMLMYNLVYNYVLVQCIEITLLKITYTSQGYSYL